MPLSPPADRRQVTPAAFEVPPAQRENGLPKPKDAPLALSPRGQADAPRPASGVGPLVTAGSSLALVLGLFLLVAWLLRRASPKGLTALPSEVVEVLGRAPLPGRQQVHLIRLGHKLVLICVSTAGAEPLAEVTDPHEVDRLAGLCREAHPQSATANFRQVLSQIGRERTAPGFLEPGAQVSPRLATARRLPPAAELEDGDV
jgi:flagellar biogenesis protein FliO